MFSYVVDKVGRIDAFILDYKWHKKSWYGKGKKSSEVHEIHLQEDGISESESQIIRLKCQ